MFPCSWGIWGNHTSGEFHVQCLRLCSSTKTILITIGQENRTKTPNVSFIWVTSCRWLPLLQGCLYNPLHMHTCQSSFPVFLGCFQSGFFPLGFPLISYISSVGRKTYFFLVNANPGLKVEWFYREIIYRILPRAVNSFLCIPTISS